MSSILNQYGQPYKAAEFNRLTSHLPSISRPTIEELSNGTLRTLRARSRYIARNIAHASGAIRHIGRRVAGAGLRIQARVRDEAGNFRREENWALERLWDERSRFGVTPDGVKALRFWMLIVRHYLIDGEVFLVGIENPKRSGVTREWQLVTGDMLTETMDAKALKGVAAGNHVELGIEMTDEGRPVAYHFYDDGYSDYWNTVDRKTKRVPAEQVIHWYDKEHADAPRGLPCLTPVILKLADLEEFFQATLVQAWAQASVVAFVKTMLAAERMENIPGRVGVNNKDETAAPARWREEMVPGVREHLLPGEDIAFADPKAPSGNIDPFTQVILRAIATGCGISYEALTRDYTKTTYSGGRLTEMEDELTFDEFSGLMDGEVVDPVWRDHVDHVYTINRLRPRPAVAASDPENIYAHFVQHPVKGHSDPVKQMTSYQLRLEQRVTSPQWVCAQYGHDFFETIDEIAEAEKYMKAAGVETAQMTAALAKQAAAPAPAPEPKNQNGRVAHV